MSCFLSMTCTLTLLQICLVPSKAMLFPPKNLTIGILDFNGIAEWLPGQGNPFGTKYTLEFIPAQHMSGRKWIPAPNCINITILKCNLAFDRHPDELFWNYFVRVKATFKGISSNWTTTSKSFQPYGDTRLSSPDVNISKVQNSIVVHFSHRLESKSGIKPLEFLLYLFEKDSTGESEFVAVKPTSTSPYIFPDVPPGKNYCVSVSASHQQASKNNFNTTQCIPSDSPNSVVVMVCITIILLTTFSTAIVVTVGYFCEKNKNHRVPNSLIIVSRCSSVLKLIHEEFQTAVQIHPKQVMNIENSLPAPEDFYLQRENLTNVIIIPSSIANVNQAEEAERSNQCYKNMLDSDLEHSEESEISEMDEDDDMHTVTPESSCAFPSDNLELPKILQTITLNTFDYPSETDGYYACSSGNDCEREVPAEEKEEQHVSLLADDSSLVDDSSEPGDYEPRHPQLFMDWR